MRKTTPLATFFCLLIPLLAQPEGLAQPQKPRSVILVIGDGMGSAGWTAMRLLPSAPFHLQTMPVSGWVLTQSANRIVTDSGAAATALASGVKTNNRMVGVDASGTARRTVLELAESTGRATGLVTTTRFWDATPASFAAHNKSRYDRDAIIEQMLQSGVDFLAGGGAEEYQTPELRSLLNRLAQAHGFEVVRDAADLQRVRSARSLVVFNTQRAEADHPQFPLATLARAALDRLARDPDGFFVLIEHEGSDGAGHGNDAEAMTQALRSLNSTIGILLEFAEKRDDVLVLVTGDHETGGLQIQPEGEGPLKLVFTTKGHTGEAIPIFAKGPGALRFTGILENDEVGRRLAELLTR